MTADRTSQFDELETLFAKARAEAPDVPEDLARRVLADANQVQGEFVARADTHRTAPRPGWFRQFTETLGGWAGLGGLVAACAAGVWIGIAPPGGWPDPATLLQDQGSYDLFQTEDYSQLLDQDGG